MIYVELLSGTKDQKTRNVRIWSTPTVPIPLKVGPEAVQKILL